MLRGLYTSTAGMLTEQRKHDTISHNVANLQTPGYKQRTSVSRAFPEMLIQLQHEASQTPKIGKINTGVFAEESVAFFAQGATQPTTRPLDLALEDRDGQTSFFVVAHEDQRYYTRDGRFALNDRGELVTENGYRVLNERSAPIVIPSSITQEQLHITKDGEILAGEESLGQIGIAVIDKPDDLKRHGYNYFLAEQVPAVLESNTVIHQFALEQSNVDPTRSMIDLMTALRAYEANQKMIQFYDKSLEKAVNEVGRV